MRISKAGKLSEGFTFVELLVVLVIISLFVSWSLPRFKEHIESKGVKAISVLDAVVDEACKEAERRGGPVQIRGILGEDVVRFADKKFDLGEQVREVRVNGGLVEGMEYGFFVYPGCVMDRVVMDLGEFEVVSHPLSLSFGVLSE